MSTKILPVLIISSLFIVSCSVEQAQESQNTEEQEVPVQQFSGKEEVATVAGGCFWCTEADFEKLHGVISAVSGYAGGEEVHPTYKEVSTKQTGHREAVQVTYDPEIVSYEEIIQHHFRTHNPTDDQGQFVDRGFQYSTAIFYHNDQQKETAERVRDEFDALGVFDAPIATPIIRFTTFYDAEEYHQDYYKKKPRRYKFYRHGSGRDQFLEGVWGST